MIDELINKILKSDYNLEPQMLNEKDLNFDKKRGKMGNKFSKTNVNNFIGLLKPQQNEQVLNIGTFFIVLHFQKCQIN
jgi:hypothetical protein